MDKRTASNNAKLRWFKSPLAQNASAGEHLFPLHPHDNGTTINVRETSGKPVPEFRRHGEATHPELFFDLFFAANLTVFSQVHQVSNQEKLTSFIGFFCMLWFTWALVALFDVRFEADSIFSRVAKAGHVGVMVGFAVVASDFHPDADGRHQNTQIFEIMSLCLMVSRGILAVQYASIVWHVRRYSRRAAKLPLAVKAVGHAVFALVYLGIAFCFATATSRVYLAWYVLAVVETLLNVGLSLVFDVLSFKGTHLVNRMVLLTFIIMGEGVIILCHAVHTVQHSNAWTIATIGVVTAAVATIYFVWMLYNDWQPTSTKSLTSWRQLSWSMLHFPFHLATVLFVGGSAQMIMWWKICEINLQSAFLVTVGNEVSAVGAQGLQNLNKAEILGGVNDEVERIFKRWRPEYASTREHYGVFYEALGNLSEDAWFNISHAPDILNGDGDEPDTNLGIVAFSELMGNITMTVENSLLATFHIDSIKDAEPASDAAAFEGSVFAANVERLDLVFTYTFVCAGATLFLLTTLFIIGRIKRWTLFNLVRVSITLLVALGLALLSLIFMADNDVAAAYAPSPWVLPTFCLVFLGVLGMYSVPRSVFSSRRGGRLRQVARGGGDGGAGGDREKLAGVRRVAGAERARLGEGEGEGEGEGCKSCGGGRQDSSVSGGSPAPLSPS